MGYTVKLDNKKVLKHLRGMPRVVQAGIVAGINKTATQSRNVGIRAMTKLYTLKAKRIKQAFTITKATRARMVATITATRGRVPGLQNYRPGRKGRKGVTVMVTKGNRQLIVGGFISPGAGGRGIGLFVGEGLKRVPSKGVYKGRRLTRHSPWTSRGGREAGQRMEREILERKFGPSVTSMFKRRGRKKARRFARENIGRIVGSEINFRLRRALGQR